MKNICSWYFVGYFSFISDYLDKNYAVGVSGNLTLMEGKKNN